MYLRRIPTQTRLAEGFSDRLLECGDSDLPSLIRDCQAVHYHKFDEYLKQFKDERRFVVELPA
jgi:hypothetical protein